MKEKNSRCGSSPYIKIITFVENMHKKYPNYEKVLSIWIEEWKEQYLVVNSSDLSGVLCEIFDWWDYSKHEEQTFLAATKAVKKMNAKDRHELGSKIGIFNAALNEAKKLNIVGVVSDQDAKDLGKICNLITEKLNVLYSSESEKTLNTKDIKTNKSYLSYIIMHLLITLGAGRCGDDVYSATKAIGHVIKLMEDKTREKHEEIEQNFSSLLKSLNQEYEYIEKELEGEKTSTAKNRLYKEKLKIEKEKEKVVNNIEKIKKYYDLTTSDHVLRKQATTILALKKQAQDFNV